MLSCTRLRLRDSRCRKNQAHNKCRNISRNDSDENCGVAGYSVGPVFHSKDHHKDKDRQEKVLHRAKVLRAASAAERIDPDGDQGQSDGQYNRSRYNRREKFTQRLDKESENTLKKTAEN